MPGSSYSPESYDRLAEIMNTIPLHIWVLSDALTYGYLNATHASFLGIDPKKASGQSIYTFLNKDMADQWAAENRAAFDRKTVIASDEWAVNAKNEKRLLHIIKTPKIDETGNVLFLTCVAEDITEQHHLAEQNLKRERILNAIADFSRGCSRASPTQLKKDCPSWAAPRTWTASITGKTIWTPPAENG
jgi:PAS domain S-box-containing protein